MPAHHVIQQLSIVGTGLIGGSALLAALDAGFAARVVVWDSDNASRARAARSSSICSTGADLADCVQHADLILIGTPVSALPSVLQAIAQAAPATAVVTDVASVKIAAIAAYQSLASNDALRFVPAHPIAGSEASGFVASRADLFRGKHVVVTPINAHDSAAIQLVRAFWERCGARVTEMPAAEHDAIYASVSHLPHLLAFAFTSALAQHRDPSHLIQLAGTGFRDFTRIAGADPTLWADICINNRDPLLHEMGRFKQQLAVIERCLERHDKSGLVKAFWPGFSLKRAESVET